ncbi:uncharacterized protein [Drosophila suzukii]|uniref:Reverse transcriptase domain-containing protein n=1 Tax=Drosophila suzukii TaxID=28584 RepID=A0ABM4TW16_DROSZ
MVKVIQINLNHCRAAQDLLAQTVIEQQADVAMLSDPYKDRHEGNGIHQSEDQRYNILQLLAPSVHISEFRTIMQEIADDARGSAETLPSDPTQVPEKQRTRKPGAKRNVLKNAIKASKAICFQELCEAADAEPFGSAYRMVMGMLNRQPTPTGHLQLDLVVSTLLPTQPPLSWQATGEGDTVLTSKAEVLAALRKTKIEKAPGPDGIPNCALHTMVANYPGMFTEMYNRFLTQRTLPIGCKRQRLVLIPKPGKNTTNLERYRTTSLASGEKEARLTRSKRSPNWLLAQSKEKALHRMGISDYLIDLEADYFKDRVLTYSSDVGEHEYQLTGGVPQGSVLGPILWNVMYDGILRQVLPEGYTVVVTVAKTIEETTDRCSLSIDTLMCWFADNGLAVAEYKTETVLISSRKIVEKATVRVGSTPIETSASINSYSVQIDCSHLKDDGQYSRTKAAQQKDHSHGGDIYYTVRRGHMGRSYEDRIIQPPVQSCLQTLRTAHHKQLLHGI